MVSKRYFISVQKYWLNIIAYETRKTIEMLKLEGASNNMARDCK